MKTLALFTLLFVSNVAFSAAINCSTSSGTTTCTSADLPASNIVPTAQSTNAPVSNLVVNNPVSATVDVYHAENTVPLKTNLFISNSGTPFNLNVNAKSKWNTSIQTNGLLQSPPASPILVVADRIANVNVDVSGYVGKNGQSSNQMCAARILAGSYGTAQSDLFKTRCVDGTTANPCGPTNIRLACDTQDISNLNTASGTPAGLCGFNFRNNPADDNNTNVSQPLSKIAPKVLRRCERPAFNTNVRTCKSREISCTYHIDKQSQQNCVWNFGGINPVAGTEVLRYSAVSHGPYPSVDWSPYASLGMGCNNYPVETPALVFNIVIRNNQYTNYANDIACPVIPATYYDNTSGTRYNGTGTPIAPGGASTSQSVSAVNESSPGFSPAGPSWPGVDVSISANLQRTIAPTDACGATEVDAGVSATGQLVPINVGFINQAETCPAASGQTPAYGDTGLYTTHNLTQTYTSINNTSVTPLQIDNIVCSVNSCPGAIVTSDTAYKTQDPLTLGTGEQGSNGANAVIFTYDVSGTEAYGYNNGLNGANGLDNITVPAVLKTCVGSSGDSTPSPQGIFHQIFWKLFTFNPSPTSYNNGFPTRNLGDAIIMMKKVSPGIRDLVKEQTCPTCP